MVEQQRGEGGERVDDEAGLHGAVHGGAGHPRARPFPPQPEDAEQQVDDLQDGDGFHGAVQVGGEEVPEDFGPEEAFERGGDLI